MKRLTSYDDIREALSELERESTSDEMDAVLESVHEQIENPVTSTLKNYMDAVYEVVEDQAPDWVDYIDFSMYLHDIASEEEDCFQVFQTASGYCVVYEDMEEDEEDWEEECNEECCCNEACG